MLSGCGCVPFTVCGLNVAWGSDPCFLWRGLFLRGLFRWLSALPRPRSTGSPLCSATLSLMARGLQTCLLNTSSWDFTASGLVLGKGDEFTVSLLFVCKWQWRKGQDRQRGSCCWCESAVVFRGGEVREFEVTLEELKFWVHLLSGLICKKKKKQFMMCQHRQTVTGGLERADVSLVGSSNLTFSDENVS